MTAVHAVRPLAALAAGLAAAAGALSAPAAAVASDTTACTVTRAELTWGVEASLLAGARAAEDGWETAGPVTHDGDAFTWNSGSGVADAALPSASVVFEGGVTLPAADGTRAVSFVDPTFVIDGERGRLLLAQADADADAADPVPLLDVDLAGATVTPDGETLTLSVLGAPTTLTAEGSVRLDGHDPGAVFAPLDAVVVADCGAAADAAPDASAAVSWWLPVTALGAVALLVALLAGGSVARRRRQAAAVEPVRDDDAAAGPTG